MSVAATKDLLDVGRNLIIVALIGADLHIRIFGASGKKVVDKAESELISGEILTALKKRLNPFPDESSLSKKDKQEIIRNATSIAGHTLIDKGIDASMKSYVNNARCVAMLTLLFATIVRPAALAASLADLPTAPLNPTGEECRVLSQTYYERLRALHRENSQCMRQPPDFGRVKSCGGRITLHAWEQCNDIELQICDVEKGRDKEYGTCVARARKAAQEKEEAKRQEQELADRIHESREIFDRYQDIRDFLNNPRDFLTAALNNEWNNTLERIFPSLRSIDSPSRDNLDLAEEIYQVMHERTVALVSENPTIHPLIRSIQREALNEIFQVYQFTLNELDSAQVQIDRISASLDRPLVSASSTRFSIPTPAPPGPQENTSPDCAVLDDPSTSRMLMQRRQQEWLALVKKCKS